MPHVTNEHDATRPEESSVIAEAEGEEIMPWVAVVAHCEGMEGARIRRAEDTAPSLSTEVEPAALSSTSSAQLLKGSRAELDMSEDTKSALRESRTYARALSRSLRQLVEAIQPGM